MIEYGIIATIFFTALLNVLLLHNNKDQIFLNGWGNYIVVVFFGLIHGLGFSNYLKALLMDQDSLFTPLLGFNLGIEVGQLVVTACILLVMLLCLKVFKIPHHIWKIVVSMAAVVICILLVFQKL